MHDGTESAMLIRASEAAVATAGVAAATAAATAAAAAAFVVLTEAKGEKDQAQKNLGQGNLGRALEKFIYNRQMGAMYLIRFHEALLLNKSFFHVWRCRSTTKQDHLHHEHRLWLHILLLAC